MAGELPWDPPSDHVVVGRRWKYAPPPWVMYEAIIEDHERWLTLLTGEIAPRVRDSRRPDAVLLQPWTDAAIVAVELRIEPGQRSGSAIRVLAYSDIPGLPDETRRAVRYRLGTLFGAALRKWVDEPHW